MPVSETADRTVIRDLLDVQDQLSEARDFVIVLVLACGSRRLAGVESTALCTVGDAARDKLEAIGATRSLGAGPDRPRAVTAGVRCCSQRSGLAKPLRGFGPMVLLAPDDRHAKAAAGRRPATARSASSPPAMTAR